MTGRNVCVNWKTAPEFVLLETSAFKTLAAGAMLNSLTGGAPPEPGTPEFAALESMRLASDIAAKTATLRTLESTPHVAGRDAAVHAYRVEIQALHTALGSHLEFLRYALPRPPQAKDGAG